MNWVFSWGSELVLSWTCSWGVGVGYRGPSIISDVYLCMHVHVHIDVGLHVFMPCISSCISLKCICNDQVVSYLMGQTAYLCVE